MTMLFTSTLQTRARVGMLSVGVQVAVLLVVLAISIKLLFQRKLQRQGIALKRSGAPSVVLVGPPSAGKTTLFHQWNGSETELESESEKPGTAIKTVTSITPNETPSFKLRPSLRLVDCPGNEKLQQFTVQELRLGNTKAAVFVVDAASGPEQIKQAAPALLTVLELTNKEGEEPIPVLIAVNKIDQFSALSVNKVIALLEGELTQLRDSKSQGLMSSTENDGFEDDSQFQLGVPGQPFKFTDLEGTVGVVDGSALVGRLDKWENWLEEEI